MVRDGLLVLGSILTDYIVLKHCVYNCVYNVYIYSFARTKQGPTEPAPSGFRLQPRPIAAELSAFTRRVVL